MGKTKSKRRRGGVSAVTVNSPIANVCGRYLFTDTELAKAKLRWLKYGGLGDIR